MAERCTGLFAVVKIWGREKVSGCPEQTSQWTARVYKMQKRILSTDLRDLSPERTPSHA